MENCMCLIIFSPLTGFGFDMWRPEQIVPECGNRSTALAFSSRTFDSLASSATVSVNLSVCQLVCMFVHKEYHVSSDSLSVRLRCNIV